MDMLCPECMGVLVVSGRRANCPLHGGQYEILFLRSPYGAVTAVARAQSSGSGGGSEVVGAGPEKVVVECPDCSQKYRISAEHVGRKGKCKKCSTEFVFTAAQPAVPPAPIALSAAGAGAPAAAQRPEAFCRWHPNVKAEFVCGLCGSAMCGTCQFPQIDGSYLCPECVVRRNRLTSVTNAEQARQLWQNEPDRWVLKAATQDIGEYPLEIATIIREEAVKRGLIAAGAAVPGAGTGMGVAAVASGMGVAAGQPNPAAMGQVCARHPGVSAVQICKVCGAAVCQTCDFSFPGNIHLCPKCATEPQKGLKGKRKAYLIWSYILAGWSTLATIFFLGGGAAGMGEEAGAEGIGLMMTFFMLIPAIIGMALGSSAMERRSKPISVWVATLWNGLIVALFILLCIVGLSMGG